MQTTLASYYVSIHARTRRATLLQPIIFRSCFCFNPRTHTACDLNIKVFDVLNKMFQSTHAHGVRLLISCNPSFVKMFQSTHAHGVRPYSGFGKIRKDCCFNPRTHTACDEINLAVYTPMICFNPRTHTACDPARCS